MRCIARSSVLSNAKARAIKDRQATADMHKNLLRRQARQDGCRAAGRIEGRHDIAVPNIAQ
jgi:hypothetical protein